MEKEKENLIINKEKEEINNLKVKQNEKEDIKEENNNHNQNIISFGKSFFISSIEHTLQFICCPLSFVCTLIMHELQINLLCVLQ